MAKDPKDTRSSLFQQKSLFDSAQAPQMATSEDPQFSSLSPPPLESPEILDRLRLIRTENVGPVTYRNLLQRYGTATEALDALPELARRGGKKKPLIAYPKEKALEELEKLQTMGAFLLPHDSPLYPRSLAVLSDAPPLITGKGQYSFLEKPMIAIVGARNASLNGKHLASALAEGLGTAGYVVVSGLARGIDTAAHNGSLASGTIAVVAGGIDIVFPPENQGLYETLLEEGCILAEMALGQNPIARHFPRRNRVISGLSLGVIIVEAALRSGSLITARYANEQGREVFAVPGSPLDQRCRGTNSLLKQGATLIETAKDVIEALSNQLPTRFDENRGESYGDGPIETPSPTDLAAYREQLLEALGPSPVTLDDIVRTCHLPPNLVVTLLMELDLAGRLERHAGTMVSLIAEI